MPRTVLAPVLIALALLVPVAVTALPTPGLNGEAAEIVYGRLFPEALETNDYIGFDEAMASLELLNERHPDLMELVIIGESVGWANLLTQNREPHSVFSVEVTNEKSPVPADKKLNLVFLLAVHGNEKGAREGGLRVIEDLLIGKGMAAKQPELVQMLDYQRLIFIFVNTDGWTHEEVEYRHNDACYFSATCGLAPVSVTKPGEPGAESQNYVRVNGNGIDLNRQYPTVGFLDTTASYRTMEQPEVRANVDYLLNFTNVAAAADVHGMLNSNNGYRILLKDGAKTQGEFASHLRLAQRVAEKINTNPYYTAWQDLPEVADAWGGDFAAYGATFDAIGYSASGTGGAFVTQHLGLGAPGFTIEQAYSHITVDNYYPGLGAQFNAFHIESMRDTVAAYMEFVRDETLLKVMGNGKSAAWLTSPVTVTDADDDPATYEGWWVETDVDDAYDIFHNNFSVSINDYFTDLAQHLDGGRLDALPTTTSLANIGAYDTVVVPGSAVRQLYADPEGKAFDEAAVAALKAYVENGGHLLLTDEALRLLAPLGIVDAGAIGEAKGFAGYTDFVNRAHSLADGLEGIVRVTYDANPLGFAEGECPIWYVDEQAFLTAKGETVGAIVVDPADGMLPVVVEEGDPEHGGLLKTHPVAQASNHEAKLGVNLGVLPLGKGKVTVFGAALPDATEVNNHPYGLEGYALSVTGNRVLLNALGFGQNETVNVLDLEKVLNKVDEIVPGATDAAPENAIPAPGLGLLAAAAVGVALLVRRRVG
ncbi:MAG TPA: M14 family metallopeptidase [Candidatus Thermoplasmatota archaeon]|nr:M14 family metallopeptidase [Candidatus Thermoplasmatota archaeon]